MRAYPKLVLFWQKEKPNKHKKAKKVNGWSIPEIITLGATKLH